MRRIHGLSRSGTYRSWWHMKNRCLNPNSKDYLEYGGRGIKICSRWMMFENFLLDMGERPENTSLDRLNNNLGYDPRNCRWATRKQQQGNRRYTKSTKLVQSGILLIQAVRAYRNGTKNHIERNKII